MNIHLKEAASRLKHLEINPRDGCYFEGDHIALEIVPRQIGKSRVCDLHLRLIPTTAVSPPGDLGGFSVALTQQVDGPERLRREAITNKRGRCLLPFVLLDRPCIIQATKSAATENPPPGALSELHTAPELAPREGVRPADPFRPAAPSRRFGPMASDMETQIRRPHTIHVPQFHRPALAEEGEQALAAEGSGHSAAGPQSALASRSIHVPVPGGSVDLQWNFDEDGVPLFLRLVAGHAGMNGGTVRIEFGPPEQRVAKTVSRQLIAGPGQTLGEATIALPPEAAAPETPIEIIYEPPTE